MPIPKRILLPPHEAVCLEALRAGADRKMNVALKAGLTLKQTQMALETLASSGLAKPAAGWSWDLTRRGKGGEIIVLPAARRRGRRPRVPGAELTPSGSASRLLALLDRPRRGAELPAMMNLTRQRIHQLVINLLIGGHIRTADPDCPSHVIARIDDQSILLSQEQERVLSAFPLGEVTKLSKLTSALQMARERVAPLVMSLIGLRLVESSENAAFGEVYQLTAAGAAHFQRRPERRQAAAPPPPFRSERVYAVLTLLEQKGALRIRDLAQQLGVALQSLNGLMQYLKRRNAVRTQTDARHSPYVLTPDGHAMLAAMLQASRSSSVRLTLGSKQESTSFLKKRSKKLFPTGYEA